MPQPKKRWTKDTANAAIRTYMADRAIQFAKFKKRVEAGKPGVEKEAQAVFGRNAIQKFLGCGRTLVTDSTAWRRIKAELHLPSHPCGASPGTRLGDSAQEEAAEPEESVQAGRVNAVVPSSPKRETILFIKGGLPLGQASEVIDQLMIGTLTDERARELVEQCIAQRKANKTHKAPSRP